MVDGLTWRRADLCYADADCRFLAIFSAGLPAGSAGDIADRRKRILFTESWMIGVALILAILTIAGAMSPWILLVLTFALSAGDAFETPAWRAILPELVVKEDLAAASALNGRIQPRQSGWAGARWYDPICCWCRHCLRHKFRIVLRCHSCCCQVKRPVCRRSAPPESFSGARYWRFGNA